jgi:hypothetical protein
VGSPYFLGVFVGHYFLLILLDYVFPMDFVYVHSSPWWYRCCLSAVVLSDSNLNHIYNSARVDSGLFVD